MTTFALLHGGMHRGWSWNLVAAVLAAHHHTVVAPELPVDDDSAGGHDWAKVAIDAIDQAIGAEDDDVVVVAHSMTGLVLPLVAQRRSIRRMVFVAGLIPMPGRSLLDILAENPDAVLFPMPSGDGAGPAGLQWEDVRDAFYHDCPEALGRRAFADLRHQSFTVLTERCPLGAWPTVPASYILTRHDRLVNPEWSRRQARELLKADVIEMDGGHSPFFSRPTKLAQLLLTLATTQGV